MSSFMSSAEKKKVRDRRSQQKLRERRNERIRTLEAQVAQYERHHQTCGEPPSRLGSESLHSLEQRLQSLERDRAELASTQAQTLAFARILQRATSELVTALAQPSLAADTNGLDASPRVRPGPNLGDDSFDSFTPPSEHLPLTVSPRNPADVHQHASWSLCEDQGIPVLCNPQRDLSDVAYRTSQTSPQAEQQPTHQSGIIDVNYSLSFEIPLVDDPPWCRGANSIIDDDLTRESLPWLRDPAKIAACPDLPDPTALLLGSLDNWLANEINKQLRKHRVAEIERLGIGWILYVYSKWRINPTEEAFKRIPAHFRVSLSNPHDQQYAWSEILVPWPALRLNICKHVPRSSLQQVIKSLSHCLKVRWPWGQEILEPEEEGGYRIRDDFFRTFFSIEGWGLTTYFMNAFPELLHGLNTQSIIFVVG